MKAKLLTIFVIFLSNVFFNIFLPNSELRIIFGVLYIFYLPGLLLLEIIIPDRQSLSLLQRLLYGFCLSIVVMVLLGLLLDSSSLGITYNSVFWSTTFLITVFIVTSTIKRIITSKEKPSNDHENLTTIMNTYRNQKPMLFLYACFTLLGLLLMFTIISPKSGEALTEFYFSDPLLTKDFSEDFNSADEVEINLTISNHEHVAKIYFIEIWANDASNPNRKIAVSKSNEIIVEDGKAKEWITKLKLPTDIEEQKVDFILYMNGQEEPYRTLTLWATSK